MNELFLSHSLFYCIRDGELYHHLFSKDQRYYRNFPGQIQMIRVNEGKGYISKNKEGWDEEFHDSSKYKERAYNLRL